MLVTLNLNHVQLIGWRAAWILSCCAFQGCAVRALYWLQGTVHMIFCMQWSLDSNNLLGRSMVS